MLKPMLQPTWQPVWQDTFRPMFGKVAQLVRSFVYFDPSAGSYGNTNINLAVGEQIEIEFTEPSNYNWQTLMSGVDRLGEVRFKDAPAEIEIFTQLENILLDGNAVSSKIPRLGDNRVHTLRATAKTPLNYRYIAARDNAGAPTSFMSGYIKAIRKYSTTGELLLDLELSTTAVENTVFNKIQPFGAELVVNGTFDSNVDGWAISGAPEDISITWEQGRALVTTTGAYKRVEQSVTIEAGSTYLVTAEIEYITGEQCYFQVRDTDNGHALLYQYIGEGKTSALVTPVGGRIAIRLHGNATAGSAYFDNVSVKKVNGYVQLVNVPDSNNKAYTYSEAYNMWLEQGASRPLYQLTGNDYIALGSSVDFKIGDTLTFDFTGFQPNGAYKRFLGDTPGYLTSLDTGVSGGKFRFYGISATLDGEPIVNEVTEIPTSGAHTISVTFKENVTLERFGDLSGLGAKRVIVALSNIKLNDGDFLHLAVNEGAGDKIRNQGLGLDATIVSALQQSWNSVVEYEDVSVKHIIKDQ